MRLVYAGKSMKTVATIGLFLGLLACAACGGSSSSSTTGALNGNWQINLQQDYPTQQAFSASGFLAESGGTVTGSVVVPVASDGDCGGPGPVSGTLSGQSVSFSINQGGDILSFTGTVSGNNSMSGDYQESGACYLTHPATGTWTATLIPSVSGNFTGSFTNSQYMGLLNNTNSPAPILVSGSLSQSSNAGGSEASVNGTITAVGYPCFATATVTGTITGQSMLLTLYADTGEQIGTLGNVGAPMVVASGSGGTSVTGNLILGGSTESGSFGPCPAIAGGIVEDHADAQFTLTSP
jgi:hypothetical protein